MTSQWFLKVTKIIWGLALCFVSLVSVGENIENDKDWEIEQEFLNQRYNDFYLHENQKKRSQIKIKKSAKEQRLERESYAAELEKARLQQLIDRNKKQNQPDPIILEKEYEKEILKKEMKYEARRQRFAKKKKELARLRENAKKIPLEREMAIEEMSY